MKKIVYVWFVITILSCSHKNQVVFDPSFGNDVETKFLPSQIIKSDMDCRYPVKLEALDTLFIIQDLGNNEIVQLYDKIGNYRSCLVKKGVAPGEVPQLTSCFISDENRISVYSTPNIIEYDIAKFLNQESDYYKITRIDDTLFTLPVSSVRKFNDLYFLEGFTDKMRFSIFDKERSMTIYNEYPEIIDNASQEKIAQIMSYASKTAFRPDHKYWIQGTYIGGTLEVFRMENNQIILVKQIFIHPPFYTNINTGVTWGKETIIGVDDIYATSNYIYVLLNGTTGADLKSAAPVTPFSNKLMVFDWQGTLVKKLETDCMIMALAVDPHDQFCHVISYSDNGYELRLIQF